MRNSHSITGHQMNERERDREMSIFAVSYLENHECQKILVSIFMNMTTARVDKDPVDFKSKNDGYSVRKRPK